MGVQEVVLVIKDGEAKRALKMPFKVEVCDELVGKLKELVGEERVRIK